MSKKLDTLSKLLNQAEQAPEGPERDAFMERALKMAADNQLDLAVARAHQAKKEKKETPEKRNIRVNSFTRRYDKKYFTELAMLIARVNDVTFLVSDYILFCNGMPSDLDVVEALYAHLSIQMVAEHEAAIKRGENITEENVYAWDHRTQNWKRDADGKRVVTGTRKVSKVHGRTFRSDFYEGFINLMASRLWEAKRKAIAEREELMGADQGELGIVLRDKVKEVKDAHEEWLEEERQRRGVQHLGEYKGADAVERRRDWSGHAREQGRSAAKKASTGAEQKAL